MALEQLIQASKVQQITMVNNLPIASKTEYDKHLLYQKNEDLYFIRSYQGEENISSLGAKLSYQVLGAAVGTYNGYAYIIGGVTDYWTHPTANIMKYNLSTNVCITLSVNLPQAIANMGYGQVGNKVYLIAGNGGDNRYNKIYCFDMETETIEQLSTTTPMYAGYIGSAVVGTKIYFTEGYPDNNGTKLYCFDTVTQQVSYKTSMTNSTSACLVYDGNNIIYCFERGSKVQAYHIDTNSMSNLPDSPYNLESASGIYYNGEILLFGGDGSSKKISSYNQETYTFTEKSIVLDTVSESMGMINIDNTVWLFGGGDSNGTKIVQKYNFPATLYGYKKITSNVVE